METIESISYSIEDDGLVHACIGVTGHYQDQSVTYINDVGEVVTSKLFVPYEMVFETGDLEGLSQEEAFTLIRKKSLTAFPDLFPA